MRQLVLASFLATFLAVSTASAYSDLPPREIALPESQVKDVFFGYIVGILLQNEALDGDGESFLDLFPEFEDGGAQVPFHEMVRVVREPLAVGARIVVELRERLDYPVPVDILGYHPGMVRSSPRLVFDESTYIPQEPGFGTVRLVWLRDGDLGIDFVAWLDILLGSWVDDVNAQFLAVAEYEEQWFILLGGETPRGDLITGVYDLRSSRIVVRPPAALRVLGSDLAVHGPRLSRNDNRGR
jgi:hypothetical protein